ncbi:MAG: hypothetical protein CMP12_02635 [Zunongwangia sp.]|jgi:hypothetical protein|uniref:Membrane protein n=2 Tax=Zunongwangia profunda TaxID=398743 RepID=D5BD68_ZUNPS|nr:hypothetical protein [Zunongwangia profunda]MAC65898.1 hypothetical protein [Flavobacteriaceae bacterium]MAO34802.1 hypothetical protein [Zunongwangia sp.]ADF52748.1 membrane protein [Zunongwangia profunda SM-A87]MAS70249.1 hypothetical protein [Zunongwangia sp.]HAJ83089.1 hypothetical protein [Zunongwangia profunda]|tara:strand:- start:866 stop:1507 length:642 start_codon:yes stop_codon:yes gene_type:complete
MDGLELLKKNWKKQEATLPKVSYDEIYKMIWKRSSSIVKWIFIISIFEFVIGVLLNVGLADKEYWNSLEQLDLKEVTIWIYGINYLITLFFVFRFYMNYRRINATSSAKKLMRDIIRTRKTVKSYILYVLISLAIVTLAYVYIIIYHHIQDTQVTDNTPYVFDALDWLKFTGITVIAIGIFLAVIWFFYQLLYGILLRRLKKNYTQLENLDCD